MKTKLSIERVGVALAALGVAVLYFRHIVLIIVAALLVYRMITPTIMKQKEGRRIKKLRRETLLWLEELIMALKAGKSLMTATKDLAISLTAGAGGAGRADIAGGAGRTSVTGQSGITSRTGDTGIKAQAGQVWEKVIWILRRIHEGKDAGSVGAGGISVPDEKALGAWRHCLGLIRLHFPIGVVYRELAGRLALPEMRSLAALIGSAVDTGANMPQVFVRSAEGLREQLESVEILESALASRRMEGCLLAAAPAAYTAFLRMITPDYMAPLYTGRGQVMAIIVFALQLGGSAMFLRLLTREEIGRSELELAGFTEEIAFHYQAGLSLPEAWQRAVSGRMEDKAATQKGDSDMLSQIAFIAKRLAMGTPFGKALDQLPVGRGGGIGLRRLVEVLRQNYQLGSGSLAALLLVEAKEIRQRCLLDRQARDAKRETVLLFPMVLLLLSALILTAAPALLSV